MHLLVDIYLYNFETQNWKLGLRNEVLDLKRAINIYDAAHDVFSMAQNHEDQVSIVERSMMVGDIMRLSTGHSTRWIKVAHEGLTLIPCPHWVEECNK